MGKVFRNGNSIAVTVPKVYVHQLHISPGSTVEWKKTREGITLVPERKMKAAGVDAKFMRMVDEFVSKHYDVLQQLAKK